MTRIDLENGKYTVINDNGKLSALRYGEPWREDMLAGDKLVLALVHRIEELEEKKLYPVNIHKAGEWIISKDKGVVNFGWNFPYYAANPDVKKPYETTAI